MELNVWVFDSSSITPLGVIDVVTGLTWEEKFADAGNFELWCPLTDVNVELLQEDNLVWIGGESAGVIEYKELSIDDSGVQTIHIQGRLAESYLDYRTIYPMVSVSGKTSNTLRTLVNNNLINPEDSDRKIPNIELAADQEELGELASYQKTGDSVLTEASRLCDANSLGFRLQFLPREYKFVFRVYEGTDRTLDQTEVNPVLFSSELDDILESNYSHNKSELRNLAYVAGEDSGENRKVQSVGSASGLSRRELYVDARDIQSEVSWNCVTVTKTEILDADTNKVRITTTKTLTNPDTGETKTSTSSEVKFDEYATEGTVTQESTEMVPMTDSAYYALLSERGKTSLEDYKDIEAFSATLRTFGVTGYEYGVDFFLGDKVTVYDARLKVRINAVVTSVMTTYDEDGERLDIVFGYEQPTLANKLKRRM